MPFVKPAVHLSRVAGTALKSFSHGYAQTVTALAAQNHNSANPLADSFVGKFRRDKKETRNVYQNLEQVRQASTSTVANAATVAPEPTARPETSHQDVGLDRYFDAWKRHQGVGTKEWQQFQFARRIEWQPPSVVPATDAAAAVTTDEVQEKKDAQLSHSGPVLKRSYTTSALDNFGKAFGSDVAAEAAALEQVNNAIAEEIQKSKDDLDDGLSLKAPTVSPKSLDVASVTSDKLSSETSATVFTPTEGFSSTSDSDIYTAELSLLQEQHRHREIPDVFKAMLRAGVQQPSAAAYQALMTSALQLHGLPQALAVYSDMLARKVTPDAPTFGLLVDALATSSTDVFNARKDLEDRLARYGGLQEQGKFMFASSERQYAELVEDASLSTALNVFKCAERVGSTLPSQACAALVTACAEHGRLEDMSKAYQHMIQNSAASQSCVYAPMISAFGSGGDLKNAVETYDQYKELAIANNSGSNSIARHDNDVYASLIKAFGSADRLKAGYKFLNIVQAELADQPAELEALRSAVALQALLPLALQDNTLKNALELSVWLSGAALDKALATICIRAADKNNLDISVQTFDSLAAKTQDLSEPAMAMLAMHVRNANVEAGEPYWRILEAAPSSLALIEPTTMRAVALIGVGQAERGLRQSRRMFSRIRDSQAESKQSSTIMQIDEAIEVLGTFMLNCRQPMSVDCSVEVLRMTIENGGIFGPVAEHVVARLGPEQIGRMNAADLEFMTKFQSRMILDEISSDVAGVARFGCLLENIVTRSVMPASETETLIEKTLINIDRAELSRLWNNYRYPQTPAALPPAPFTPTIPYQEASPFLHGKTAFDDSFEPYAHRTDVKGSNLINDLLERPQGRRMNEALTKFRNMRRVGRVARMFTYGKLIEAAAKEHNLNLAHDILEMAKQDVPYDARYRVVRFGWQQILDHMVAGCLTIGRRDLAARYHQDLIEMGTAPSANTFGLYITTLKENTKTFDEASEAVKIFLRAKAEGVELTSFLYNALIGKLGKARRIDDCLFYFAEMRNLGIRPTSVTYGTIVNALCRVSDEKFAEEIFEEMESCTNYKPRPAPYHSLMQFFLGTKRDRSKVIAYYERMRSKGIEPTVHTYKLLIDTHATLEPVNMAAAESVLQEMRAAGIEPEAVHYSSLIHAKGCVLHDLEGARALFDYVLAEGRVRPQPCMYQALFESLNANHAVGTHTVPTLLADMAARGVEFTPYIANALIHGWTLQKDIVKAKEAFMRVPMGRREPSTYEAMVRAYLAIEDRNAARSVVKEALGRGYPSAVAGKIAELVR